MKAPPIPLAGRAGLASVVICAVVVIFPICPAEVITIHPEADTKVESAVPFPYSGTSGQLYVGYETVWAPPSITRSYLRFSLAGIEPADRIQSARLNIYADTVWTAGNVDLYRSENDSWPEAATNFGNQPGYSEPQLDTLLVTQAGTWSWELLRLSNWESWRDVADHKVTLMIKTPEIGNTTGISFASRENGSFPSPSLVITTRRPGEIVDSDFAVGGLPWDSSGDVSIIPDPEDASDNVALLRTSSPASIWQTIDTPDSPFSISFGFGFLHTHGTLTVTLGGEVRLTVPSPEEAYGITVTDPALFGRRDLDLMFTLTGPEGVVSEMLLDYVNIFALPMPRLILEADEAGEDVALSFPAEPGGYYWIQRSLDGVNWDDHGRRIAALELTYEEEFPVVHPAEFFRLRILSAAAGEPWELEYPNYHFELPVLGDNGSTTSVPNWTSSGGAGVWNPTTAQYPPEMYEDENVAYVHQSESLSQTLSADLEPFRFYYLSALVGKRPDIGFPSGMQPDLILRAGGVALTPIESESPAVAAGTFEWWQRRYRIGNDHPQLGQPLEIILSGGTSGTTSQVNFDAVFLDYD